MTGPLDLYSSTERVHLDRIRACIQKHGYRNAAELGVFTGGSLLHIVAAIQANGGGTVVGIDSDAGLLERAQSAVTQWAESYPDVRVTLVRAELPEAIPLHVPMQTQFVFIDDFHDAEHVAREVALLLPRMARPGTIMGHDVNNPRGIGTVFEQHGGRLHTEGCGLGEMTLR